MSVLFYRRPDYLNKANGPINKNDCQLYVQRAKSSQRVIPDGLSFDEIINKKTLPPCSVGDFMDYLVYIEHDAENLQFFLWYKDYCRRFDALPEKEKALSPAWVQETEDVPDLSKDSEKDPKKKVKRETIQGMMESGYDTKGAALFSEDKMETPMSPIKENGSHFAPSVSDATTVPTNAEVTAQAGLKWQGFTVQPMRDEVNRVMRHYLAFTAPRELNLSHKDRALCLHALQHTTHPSAFLPAVNIAETALRGQSHPNFVRWSICNGNKPRVFFVRTMGVSNILFGFLIAILLTLSRASRWFRIFAALEWFIGISTMVCAYKGLCIIMHHSHSRNLRPWEQDLDVELGENRRNSTSSTAQRDTTMASRTGHYDDSSKEDDDASSTFAAENMNVFGPKNSFDSASWISKYEKRPILSKVFEKHSVWTQDDTLRILQDKIVLGANLWAVILTVPLTIIFVALPKGNFY
ncbi:hypothetical protein LSUE1_G001217 [Lachnellula suecica]|uniref:RGS domain-containing protein n=1 Tax=Lachnellula suecica TaxID=602035 RepID=A0A8T9CF02_9HELO|nr:hypothetical protein LSUE1_G001217 [Lachnellula suecica]